MLSARDFLQIAPNGLSKALLLCCSAYEECVTKRWENLDIAPRFWFLLNLDIVRLWNRWFFVIEVRRHNYRFTFSVNQPGWWDEGKPQRALISRLKKTLDEVWTSWLADGRTHWQPHFLQGRRTGDWLSCQVTVNQPAHSPPILSY